MAVVGAGPAGLMAAERLATAGVPPTVFDGMGSVGRKFLLAGRGGLNLTHSEPFEAFRSRYGSRSAQVGPWLERFSPADLRAWAEGLGIETFVGSSGRVFPRAMKAAPLLRAWLQRLNALGVQWRMRHRWLGCTAKGGWRFDSPDGERAWDFDAVVLALGGASWPRLGSDGAWVVPLREAGAGVAPLRPANCGFDVALPGRAPGWSTHLRERFAGAPLKSVAIELAPCAADGGLPWRRHGEFVITSTGIEGSLVYAASAALRDRIEAQGHAELALDLVPGRDAAFVRAALQRPRGTRSLGNHLRRVLGLDAAKSALLAEVLGREGLHDAQRLADALKALPLRLSAPRPIDEAISSAGGVRLESLDDRLMLKSWPGVFCAGEMLDWEAPTGGYLLNACFASGRLAAEGVLRWQSDIASEPAAAPR